MKELILLIAIILIVILMQSLQKKAKTGSAERKNRPTSLELGFGGKIASPAGYNVTAVDMQEFKEVRDPNEEDRKVHIVRADMEKFCKGKYDQIMMNNSWHYVDDYAQMLNNLKRMLKPGGKIIITEPGEDSHWNDPVLNRDSPDFIPMWLKYKLLQVNKGWNILRVQNTFHVESHQREDKGYNYVLTL